MVDDDDAIPAPPRGGGRRRGDLTGRLRRGPSLSGLASSVAVLVGCVIEPAVVVKLEVPSRERTHVCLSAFGEGEVRFAQSYDREEANGGTLAFAAGEIVSEELRLVARLRRGGRTLATTFQDAAFAAPADETRLRLEEGCRAEVSSLEGQVVAMAPGDHLMAFDVNGDGQDEVVVGGAGATAIFLDGSTRVLHSDNRRMLLSGDVNGDCRDELVEQGIGVGADGLDAAVAEQALAAALGDGGRGARMALVGPWGMSWYEHGGGTRFLDDRPSSAVLVADLNGDDMDDIVRAGPRILDVWVGSVRGPQLGLDMVPRGWTGEHLALGDLDGDGVDDVVVGAGDQVLVGRNSNGALGARSGAEFDGVVVSGVWALDVDGDCRDEVVAVAGGMGYLIAAAEADGTLGAPVELGPTRSATAADMNGDGVQELYLLRPDASVERWLAR